jgi:hypothetical protein
MKTQRYSALLLTFVVGTAVGLQPIDADAAGLSDLTYTVGANSVSINDCDTAHGESASVILLNQ